MSALAMRETSGGLVSLSEVLAGGARGQRPAPGFEAWLRGSFVDGSECGGGPFQVTAVLERTSVLQVASDDRRLARHDALLVEAETIEWRAESPRSSTFHPPRRPRTQPALEASGPAADVPEPPGLPVGQVEPEQPEDSAEALRCGRCDAELPRHNRRGLCVPCQRACPACGGVKSIQAERCRGCERGGQPEPAPRSPARLALEYLPARVSELLDDILTLARYAGDLEDELDRLRAAQRQAQRIGRRALAAAERQP